MGGDGLKMKPSVLMVIVTRYSCTNESQERVKRAQRGAEDDPKRERNTDSRRCLFTETITEPLHRDGTGSNTKRTSLVQQRAGKTGASEPSETRGFERARRCETSKLYESGVLDRRLTIWRQKVQPRKQ